MRYSGSCELCDTYAEHLNWTYWYKREGSLARFTPRYLSDVESVSTGSWKDVGLKKVCDKCLTSPPAGWRRAR